MGYGGNLIWTTVFKALNARTGRAVAPVHMPLLSDLAAGVLYDRSVSLAEDAIYCLNPRLVFPPARAKNGVARLLDAGFVRALSLLGLRRVFELWVVRRASARDDGQGPLLVHVDMRVHSYAARQDQQRTYWKSHARAADAMLEHMGGGTADDTCEMYFSAAEETATDALLAQAGIDGPFVAFEPETNRDFFGDLRAWPRENWEAMMKHLAASHPHLQLVQVGAATSVPAIAGAVDLRGETSFRAACLVLKRARLFLGTESGLMHAANAVGARALILWGGLTLPEFIGYPQRQRTLCKYVPCAPCGNNGWCDNARICMTRIGVDEALAAANEMLEAA
jgi:hypothetical protein